MRRVGDCGGRLHVERSVSVNGVFSPVLSSLNEEALEEVRQHQRRVHESILSLSDDVSALEEDPEMEPLFLDDDGDEVQMEKTAHALMHQAERLQREHPVECVHAGLMFGKIGEVGQSPPLIGR